MSVQVPDTAISSSEVTGRGKGREVLFGCVQRRCCGEVLPGANWAKHHFSHRCSGRRCSGSHDAISD